MIKVDNIVLLEVPPLPKLKNSNFYCYSEYKSFEDNNIFKVKSFDKGFNEIYQKITQIDMYEGWVLKKKNAKLKNGLSEKNNTDSQMKFRKPTKNYSY